MACEINIYQNPEILTILENAWKHLKLKITIQGDLSEKT